MDFGSVPYLHLTGTPHQRGLTYGRSASPLIHRAVAIYAEYFLRSGVEWTAVRQAAAGVWDFLEQEVPASAAEIAGIAQGSGRDLWEVVALNARTEIAYGLGQAWRGGKAGPTPDGCTALAVLPEHTGGLGVLAGQNWDWLASCMPVRVALHVELANGHELLTFCEAGQLGKLGVNSSGLVVCLNLLSSSADGLSGMPVHLLCRLALEQAQLSQALRVVGQWPRASSSNLLLAQGKPGGDGEALDVEFSPRGWRVLEPEGGFLAHTNHFLTDCNAEDRGTLWPGAKSTFVRLSRARRQLERWSRYPGTPPAGQLTPRELMTILADHWDYPYGICHHLPPPPEEGTQTNLAFVCCPGTGELWFSDGPPCGQGRPGPSFRHQLLPWAARATGCA